MGNFSDNFLQKKYIKYPAYFILCLAVGYGFWALTSEDEKIQHATIQLSSIAKAIDEVRSAEFITVNRLSLGKNENIKVETNESVKQLPKRFKGNPAFKFFVYIEEIALKGPVFKRTGSTEKFPSELN